MKKIIKQSVFPLIVLALLGGGYYFYKQSKQVRPEDLYKLAEITRGDLEQAVSANGTINPVTLVSVGTQVSGRVSKLYVDFNDKVEKGQVLLELDDALFTAQIAQTQGTVRNAEASVELAKANEARSRALLPTPSVCTLSIICVACSRLLLKKRSIVSTTNSMGV